MDAEKIAESMRAKVQQADTDPAYRTPVALDDYARALRAILPPLLAPRDPSEAMQQELLRRTQVSGAAQRLAEAGVTERALLGLAQRLAGSIEDVDQAWIELQNLVEIHLRLQREGHTPSNQGDFVDEVLRRVADLPPRATTRARGGHRAGAGEGGREAHQPRAPARQRRRDRHAARRRRHRRRLPDRKADLDAGGQAPSRTCARFRTAITRKAATPAPRSTSRSPSPSPASSTPAPAAPISAARRSTIWRSRCILGERESGPRGWKRPSPPYRAALEERTRDRVPLDWAATQMNLGNALQASASARAGPRGWKRPSPPTAPRSRRGPATACRWTGPRRR